MKTVQMQKNLIEKAFFGKNNCLKIQFNLDKQCYFQFGKESNSSTTNNGNKEWMWKKVKFNDVELGSILSILNNNIKEISFYHKFNENVTQIWIKKINDSLLIKTNEISKSLNIGEQEVLKVLLTRIILQNSTAI